MIIKLLKIRTQALLSSIFTGTKTQQKSKGFWYGIGFLLLAVFISYGAVIEMLFERFAEPFYTEQLNALYYSIVALFIFAVSVLVNIFMVQSQLFESKDINILLSLPIKVSSILYSRMTGLLLFSYLIEAIIGVPAIVALNSYGAGVAAREIVFYIISLILLGGLSLAVSCLLGYLVTKITAHTLHRNAFQTVLLAIILMAFTVIVYVSNNSLMEITGNADEVESVIKTFFYPIYCFGEGCVSGGISSFIIFAAVSAAALILTSVILSKSFLKIVNTSYRLAVKEYESLSIKRTSTMNALVKKELKLIFSDAMYLINAALGNIICIILSILMIVKKDLLVQVIGTGTMESVFPALLVVILCLINVLNVISAPSVSLEGESLWLPKSLPLSGRTILLSKALAHCVVCIPTTLLAAIVMNVQYDMSAAYRIYSLVTPLCMIGFMALLGVVLNLKYPNFTFVNVTAAVKQSISVLIAMIIPAIVLGILTAVFLVVLKDVIAAPVFFGLLTILLIVANLILYGFLNRNGERLFRELGE